MSERSFFSEAFLAIVDGDETKLRALLQAHPELVHARADEPHRATLLHYLSANGIEPQRSPKNAVRIARILLDAGSDPDATAFVYGQADTMMELLVSSVHPWKAGVQAPLVDLLLDFGATPPDLGVALMFGYTRAAERLAIRGARVDNIVYAAGLGQTDLVRQMLATGTGLDNVPRRTDDHAGPFSFPLPRDADARELALIAASMHDRLGAVRALLDAGVSVDAAPFCRQTPLHFAAHLGCGEVFYELLARGADRTIVDTRRNETAAGWARWGDQYDLAAELDG
jgi:ankyrin repeat protein